VMDPPARSAARIHFRKWRVAGMVLERVAF
jgi:hypothetical protein